MTLGVMGILGYLGVMLLLLAYFLLITGQLKVIDMQFVVLNLFGGVFILASVYAGAKLPMIQAVIAWIGISVYGFYKHHISTAG